MPKTTFNEFQQRTVSKAAAKTLSNTTGFDLPNIVPITDRMILRMRQRFQAGEDKVEGGIIREHQLDVQNVTCNGVDGLLIKAPDAVTDKGIIMNIHGGGFIMGTARDRNALLAATETHLPVYSVEYTLSPEVAAPTALIEVEKFYRGLLEEHKGEPVTIMGSSSGANLAASMLVRAHAHGLPMPAAAALFCPALDISGNGDSAVFNNRRDVMSAHLARRLAGRYVGDMNATSPDISPMYAVIGPWFPPTYMTSGTRDVMMSNVLRFTDKLKVAGVPNGYTIKEGMWHGFTWEEHLPEAVATRKEAWDFVNRYNHG